MKPLSGILLLALALGGCGKENPPPAAPNAATPAPAVTPAPAPNPTANATPAAPPLAQETSPAWVAAGEGNERFVARLAHLEAALPAGLQEGENCVQVIRPLPLQGDVVGMVEFLPQACADAPIVAGTKNPAFSLKMKKHEGVQDASPLAGLYDLFYAHPTLGEVRVGAIQFDGDRAVVTELCAGAPESALCEIQLGEGKYQKLVVHEAVVVRVAKEQAEAALSESDRAKRTIEEARGQIEASAKQMTAASDFIAAADKKSQEEIAAAKAEVVKAQEALTAEQKKVEAQAQELAALQGQVATLTAESAKNAAQLEQARQALAQASEQLKAAQEQVAKVQVEIDQAKVQVEAAKAEEVPPKS